MGSSPQSLDAMTSSDISSFYDLPTRPSSDAGWSPLAACFPRHDDLSPAGMSLPLARPFPGHRPQGTGQGTEQGQREGSSPGKDGKLAGELRTSPRRPGGWKWEQGVRERSALEG